MRKVFYSFLLFFFSITNTLHSQCHYLMYMYDSYGDGWNSLRDKSINEVMQHPWFDKILTDSWDPNHSKHLPRCIRTCAYNKAYHNEINHNDKVTA